MVHYHGAIAAFCVLLAVGAGAHEALVEKATGKIEVVKPDGAPWGIRETNGTYYVVKRITDMSLAKKGVLIWPYKATNKQGKVTNKSRYYIKLKANDATPLQKDGPNFSTNLAVALSP